MIGEERPPQALGRYTGFLLNWIGARSRAHFTKLMAEIGLHPREFGVMNVIDAAPGRTQQDIATASDTDPSTMVATLDALEERGLAERRPHADDRRKRAVYLTAKGKRTLTRARDLAEAVGDEAFAPLTAAERKELNRLLRKVAGIDDGV